MSNENTYNGWTNYETWNVALWLSNDQGSDEMCREMVEEAGSVNRAADRIQVFVEEMNPLASDASMFSDILSAALHQVDWIAVADSFKPDEWGDSDEAPEDEDEPDDDDPGDAAEHTSPDDLDLQGHGAGDEYALIGVYGSGPIDHSTAPWRGLREWYWLRESDFDYVRYPWEDHNTYPRD